MVLTVLCFMLNPPWCMGSRLNNSTLSPIPGKVKSSLKYFKTFAPPKQDVVTPLSGRLRQEVGGKDGVFPCISGIFRLIICSGRGIIKL